MRMCNKCGLDKEESEFSLVNKNRKYTCLSCIKIINKAYNDKKRGDYIPKLKFNVYKKTCLLCDRKHYLDGLCSLHYNINTIKMDLDFNSIKCWCGEKHLSHGLCKEHFVEHNKDVLKNIKDVLIESIKEENIIDLKRDMKLFKIKRKHNMVPNLNFMLKIQDLFIDNNIPNPQGVNLNNIIETSDFNMFIIEHLIE